MIGDASSPGADFVRASLTVVIATRNRCRQLQAALDHLLGPADPADRPRVIVVDNASTDDTVTATRARHPEVLVIVLDRNEGAAARNIGAATASTRFVAFNDDDSWWCPGSLRQAGDLLDRHPRIGLVAARVMVGHDERLDPTCALMDRSPLADEPATQGLPGLPVLGFLACAAAVRRSAFLAVGGFSRALFIVGEEAPLAMDLAAAGWAVRYVDSLAVRHQPETAGRDPSARMVQQQRNALLTHWMRRPARRAVAATAASIRSAVADRTARDALARAVVASPAAWRERRVVPAHVEAELTLLEAIDRADGLRPRAPSADASPRPPPARR